MSARPLPTGLVYIYKGNALVERGFLSGGGSSISKTRQDKPAPICPAGSTGTRGGLHPDHGNHLDCKSHPEGSLLACLRLDRRNHLGTSRWLDSAGPRSQRPARIALDRWSRPCPLGGRDLHRLANPYVASLAWAYVDLFAWMALHRVVHYAAVSA